jgi:hypothetical protein
VIGKARKLLARRFPLEIGQVRTQTTIDDFRRTDRAEFGADFDDAHPERVSQRIKG